MSRSDYAFMKRNNHVVNERNYDKHHPYDYDRFLFIPSLLDELRSVGTLDSEGRRDLWDRIIRRSSRPVITLDVLNYDEPEYGTRAEFLVDTGADFSILTADTADVLGLDLGLHDGDDPVLFNGITGATAGRRRWIYVSLAGRLHTIPVLIPLTDNPTYDSSGILSDRNLLGRAAITSCFLMCFDNKRLYAFARWLSERPY